MRQWVPASTPPVSHLSLTEGPDADDPAEQFVGGPPPVPLPDRQQEWRDRDTMGDSGPVTDDIAAGSPASDAAPPVDGYVGDPAVRAEWDNRYADREQLWSGQPNGALVAEVAGLTPGRVLDVGCGEGADAVWLARGRLGRDRARGLGRGAGAGGRARAGRRCRHSPGCTPDWRRRRSRRRPSTWSPRSTRPCCALPTPRPSARCSQPSRPAACCCSCTTRAWTPSGGRQRLRPGRLRLAVDGHRPARRRLAGRAGRATATDRTRRWRRRPPHRRSGAARPAPALTSVPWDSQPPPFAGHLAE